MAHLHCPNCGKRIEIDLVGDFIVRWSTQECDSCGTALSIRYDLEAIFVRYSQKTKRPTRKVISIDPKTTNKAS